MYFPTPIHTVYSFDYLLKLLNSFHYNCDYRARDQLAYHLSKALHDDEYQYLSSPHTGILAEVSRRYLLIKTMQHIGIL